MRIAPKIIIAIILLTPFVASADYIEPGDVSVHTEEYTPAKTDFSEGRYKYSIEWQGISVAEAEIDVRSISGGSASDGYYDVTAKAKTEGLVRVFYKMKHTSSSVFDAKSLRPVKFESYQMEKRREKKREVSFKQDGTIEFVSSKNGEVNPSKSFHSSNYTLDPISAAFVARSLPIELGTTARFDVFNGKHRFLITCKVEAREKIEIDGREYDAFRVVPTVEKLTDSESNTSLESATIWISADEARHVLKIESEVWVGSVTAELRGFTPYSSSSTDLARAALGN